MPPTPAPAPVALAPNAVVDSTGRQIHVRLPLPPDQAAPLVLQALVDRGLPVTSNQGGVIEAKLPREMGLFAQYEITVRAYVTPNESGGTRVLLLGEETSYSNLSAPIVTRIGRHNQGRALATWRTLEAIAQALGSRP